ncbi:MAG: hypothetical protein WDW36_005045 [Sanguina aurantia]
MTAASASVSLGSGPVTRALTASNCPIVPGWLINPDCLVTEADLRRLLEVVNSNPKVGLVGAVVCDADGRPDPASWQRDPLLRRAVKTMFGSRGDGVNINEEIPAEVVQAEAVSGALMLMPRAVFNRVGGFDEDYFLHCEDLER